MAAKGVWPTPQARDHKSGRTLLDYGNSRPLSEAALWPTPRSTDGGHAGLVTEAKCREGGTIVEAISARTSWPTPTSGDAKSSGSRNTETSKANPGVSLTDAIRGDGGTGRTPWPRSDDADYDKLSGHLRGVAIASGGEATPARSGLSLNPDWVELLMGWPRFWTKVDPMPEAEFKAWLAGFLKGTVRFGEGPEYGPEAWADGSWERGQARVGTQIENRVGRLRALGNGQVPICVVLAWLELADRLDRG